MYGECRRSGARACIHQGGERCLWVLIVDADAVTQDYQRMQAKGECILGQKIARLVTVNGVRVTLDDGTWGLVRASSNKPSLVVVCESPVSLDAMHAMFRDIDARLSKFPEVGEYDQKI